VTCPPSAAHRQGDLVVCGEALELVRERIAACLDQLADERVHEHRRNRAGELRDVSREPPLDVLQRRHVGLGGGEFVCWSSTDATSSPPSHPSAAALSSDEHVLRMCVPSGIVRATAALLRALVER
jgi:hypothetical protein